jgi:hypothetical protein
MYVHVALFIHGCCVPAIRRVYGQQVKRETCNNHHFYVKNAPQLFYDNLIICIIFPEKPREVSTPLIRCKIWPRIGY